MRKINLIIVFLLTVIITGCSSKQPLGGKVTFPDGKPVTTGTVYLVTDTFLARGDIQSDGTYTVGSDDLTDGLPAGEYKVYIVNAIAEVAPAQTETKKEGDSEYAAVTDAKRIPLVHPQYTTLDTTPLKFTVPGKNRFDFTVERP